MRKYKMSTGGGIALAIAIINVISIGGVIFYIVIKPWKAPATANNESTSAAARVSV